MTFKLRRVTSGLLPQQHIPGSKSLGSTVGFGREQIFQDPSTFKSVTSNNHKSTGPSNGTSSDVPLTQSKPSSSSRFVSTKIIGSATQFDPHRNQLQNPNGDGMQFDSKLDARTYSDEAEFIRQNKLITDDNIFSPQSTAGRRVERTITIQKSMAADSLEFDPSDRDLPVKLTDISRSRNVLRSGDEQFRTDNNSETTARSKTQLEGEQPSAFTHTPRRSSPLRQVYSKDSADTTTEEVVNALSESSALRPKTTKEIFDQINSSIERFRVYENERLNNYSSLDESDASNEGIFKSLDSILPRRGKVESGLPKEHVFKQNISDQRESSVLELGSPVGKKLKVFTKYSTKNLKRSSADTFAMRKTKFKPWTVEKWKMLEALVQLSVPNSVIVHNKMVQSRLGCDTQKELAQRVQFIVQRLKR